MVVSKKISSKMLSLLAVAAIWFIRFTFGKLWGEVDHRFYLNLENMNACVCFLGVTNYDHRWAVLWRFVTSMKAKWSKERRSL